MLQRQTTQRRRTLICGLSTAFVGIITMVALPWLFIAVGCFLGLVGNRRKIKLPLDMPARNSLNRAGTHCSLYSDTLVGLNTVSLTARPADILLMLTAA